MLREILLVITAFIEAYQKTVKTGNPNIDVEEIKTELRKHGFYLNNIQIAILCFSIGTVIKPMTVVSALRNATLSIVKYKTPKQAFETPQLRISELILNKFDYSNGAVLFTALLEFVAQPYIMRIIFTFFSVSLILKYLNKNVNKYKPMDKADVYEKASQLREKLISDAIRVRALQSARQIEKAPDNNYRYNSIEEQMRIREHVRNIKGVNSGLTRDIAQQIEIEVEAYITSELNRKNEN